MGFAIKQKLFDRYYLIAVDVEEELDLSYESPYNPDLYWTVVKETVFGVGYNRGYIIVEQHPKELLNPPNKSITNYFILPIAYQHEHGIGNFGLIGPLTSEEFNKKRKELNIPDSLKFTIIKDDLK
jgi:hypothetical protein